MTANLSVMNLLLATRNEHKTREFTQLLGPNFALRDLTRRVRSAGSPRDWTRL
jgi:inosine/xanthosine triphosphate pyrophosphatase family protein